MKNKPRPRILPGFSVKENLGTVTVTPEAFASHWPFNGKTWPCKGELTEPVTFHFDSSGDLCQIDGGTETQIGEDWPFELDQSALSACAEDCKTLLSLCSLRGGRELAVALLNPDSPAGVELINKAKGIAKSYGAKLGSNSAEWIIQESWGGRVSSIKESQANARALLQRLEDGDPAIYDGLPSYGEGETVNSFALCFLYCFDGLDTENDEMRDCLEKLGLTDDFKTLADEMEEWAREGFSESLFEKLESSARAEIENGKGEAK